MAAFRPREQAFRAAKVIAVLALVASGLLLFSFSWTNHEAGKVQKSQPGVSDFGQFAHARDVHVIEPTGDEKVALQQLATLVRKAAAEGKRITIAGSRHSMGGQTLLDSSYCIDMSTPVFHAIGPVTMQDGIATVRVGAGATWKELLSALDRTGWSVAVMQSNDDFTVGGSVSVNCHGWQPHSPPLDSTVVSFRILLADGSVRECGDDRACERDLFRAVCGGYGLLGVILDVTLRVVPNELYQAEESAVRVDNYAAEYERQIDHSAEPVGLAYGRLSVAPGSWFLRDARIIRFLRRKNSEQISGTLQPQSGYRIPASELSFAGAVFRGSMGSDFLKWLRWSIERVYGQTHRIVSRNAILQTSSEWFANRDPHYAEILHEYFVPPAKFAEFVRKIRPILRADGDLDLLNITVRKVERDDSSLLAYAPEERFGLVMLFRYPATQSADQKMRALTQRLIDVALRCGGSYYLPYRTHATPNQFRRAYPQWKEFLAIKRQVDPQQLFENSFATEYLR